MTNQSLTVAAGSGRKPWIGQQSKGIILADTKFEFGLIEGALVHCDEAKTPDSSRYWPAAAWDHPGKPASSFDKRYVRDYTQGLGWDKTYPGPEFPQDVVDGTRACLHRSLRVDRRPQLRRISREAR